MSIDALPGLAVETILLVPFAVGYLVWCEFQGTEKLGHSSALVDALLLMGGIVTSIPLFLFAYGARRIPYSTIGVLQFIAPSLQLLCGLVVFVSLSSPHVRPASRSSGWGSRSTQ